MISLHLFIENHRLFSFGSCLSSHLLYRIAKTKCKQCVINFYYNIRHPRFYTFPVCYFMYFTLEITEHILPLDTSKRAIDNVYHSLPNHLHIYFNYIVILPTPFIANLLIGIYLFSDFISTSVFQMRRSA